VNKIVPLLIALGATSAFSQSAFQGTWRLNTQTAEFKGPDKYLLQDGIWHCDSCSPKQNIKADGKPQTVAGSPYYDMATVNVVNDRTIEITTEKNGQHRGKHTMTASEDGKSLTSEFSFTTDSGHTGSVTTVSDRVGEPPASENKVSGTWQQRKLENASTNIVEFTYNVTDEGMAMSDPMGDSYLAKFDGQDYPYKGDPGTTSVSLKKIGANSIEETDKRNGKVITVGRMTVSPDGKTMTVTVEDKLHNQTSHWTAEKQ